MNLVELAEVECGLVGVTESFAKAGGLVISAGTARLKAGFIAADRGAVAVQRTLEVAAVFQQRSHLHERLRVVGIDLERLNKIGASFVGAVFVNEQNRKINHGPLGFLSARFLMADSLPIPVFGLVALIAAFVAEAQILIGANKVRCKLDRLFAFGNGFVETVVGVKQAPQKVMRSGIGRIETYGGTDGCLRTVHEARLAVCETGKHGTGGILPIQLVSIVDELQGFAGPILPKAYFREKGDPVWVTWGLDELGHDHLLGAVKLSSINELLGIDWIRGCGLRGDTGACQNSEHQYKKRNGLAGWHGLSASDQEARRESE